MSGNQFVSIVRRSLAALLLILPVMPHSFVPALAADAANLEMVIREANGARAVYLSRGGDVLISSGDRGLTFWDTTRGYELLTLPLFSVYDIEFSPLGDRIAVSNGPTLIILSADTGRELDRFEPAKEESTWYWSHKAMPVAWHPNGRLIALGGHREVVLYDTLKHRETARWEAYSKADGPGLDKIAGLAISADGSRVATYVGGKAPLRLWNLKTRKLITERTVDRVDHFLSQATNSIVAVSTRANTVEVLNLEDGDTTIIQHAMEKPSRSAVSANGRWLAIEAEIPEPGRTFRRKQLHVLDMESGAWREPIDWSAFRGAKAIMSDGSKVVSTESGSEARAVGYSRNILRVTPLTGNEPPRLIGSQIQAYGHAASDKNSRWLLIGKDRGVEIWENLAGRGPVLQGLIYPPDVSFDAIPQDVSRDGRYAVIGGSRSDDGFYIYEIATKKLIKRLETEKDPGQARFSNDGQFLAFSDKGGRIAIYDLVEDSMVVDEQVEEQAYEVGWSLAFSNDGEHLYVAYGAAVLSLNARTFNIEKQATIENYNENIISRITENPSGTALALESSPYQGSRREVVVVSLPELKTEVTLENMQMPIFASDKVLLLRGLDDNVQRYDLSIRSFSSLDAGKVGELHYAFDGAVLVDVAGSRLHFRDPETLAVRATLVPTNNGSWLAAAPNGVFAGTPVAWDQFVWRFGDSLRDVAPPSLFYQDYFRPDLLLEATRGPVAAPPTRMASLNRTQPMVSIEFLGVRDPENVLIDLEIHVRNSTSSEPRQSDSGAQGLRLFRNDRLIRRWDGDILDGAGERRIKVTVPFSAATAGSYRNLFEAYAFNRDGVKSVTARIEVSQNVLPSDVSLGLFRRQKGAASIVTIGVNDYEDSSVDLDLLYAVPDAELVGETIRATLKQSIRFAGEQRKPEKFDNVMLLSLHEEGATKKNILRALAMFAGKPGAIDPAVTDTHRKFFPARPEHVLFIYFAGHGWSYEGRYYLLPYDFRIVRRDDGSINLQQTMATAVSDQELEEALADIDAANLVLILDTCYSEQAIAAETWRPGPFNLSGMAQLIYEKQIVFLSASQSRQRAVETNQYGHGLLAYTLMHLGLIQGKGDAQSTGGAIGLSELLAFSVNEVPNVFRTVAEARARDIAFEEVNELEIQRPVLFDQRRNAPERLYFVPNTGAQ